MPTQKIFKQRVRTRMAKTGESYTAARRQLLRRAGDGAAAVAEASAETAASSQMVPPNAPVAVPADFVPTVSAESLVRASGKAHGEWFAILDAWGATEHTHTEIARWLRDVQGVPGWWDQNITVDYERARGMRSRHEMRDGFSVSATKTIAVDAARALAAFTDEAVRALWFPDAQLRRRPTRAALAARFDWDEPASRVIVGITPKGDKVQVAVSHEQLPDAAVAAEMKALWRDRLVTLKGVLERD